MPQNGDTNKRFGVYKSLCCGKEIILREGVPFPDCPNHAKLTTIWKAINEEQIPRAVDLKKKRSA